MASIETPASYRSQKYVACFVFAILILNLTATAWAQGSRSQTKGKSVKSSPGLATGKGKSGPPPTGPKAGTGELVLSRPVLPEKYVLGPGDQLTINLWGEYDSFENYTISAEGKVSIPTIGELKFIGLTLAEAEALLRKEVETYYRNVSSGISLVVLRSFVVSVLGAVHQPGNYSATLDKRVSDLIDSAGGVLPGGSQRHIQVLQQGKVRVTSDLSAFLRRGVIDADPYLKDGDVIYVPPVRGPSITVFDDAIGLEDRGSVALPITYELVDGQRFSSVISELGGVNPAWDMEHVFIMRRQPGTGDPKRILVNLSELFIQMDETKDIVMQNGDQLFFAIDLRRPYLDGLGEVRVDVQRDNRRGSR